MFDMGIRLVQHWTLYRNPPADLRWTSFKQQLPIGRQYLSSKMWQGSWILQDFYYYCA